MDSKRQDSKRGPKPDHLVVEGDWESAIGKALGKKRPATGWPERATRSYKSKKKRARKSK